MTDLCATILDVATRQPIRESDFEAGYEAFVARTGLSPTRQDFADAVAALVAKRLVRDPVRLMEGALQCRWHLEATPAGRDAGGAG
ncbi:MAG: hypothetical protein AB7O80_12475 [Acetobacteraceae bacterium]